MTILVTGATGSVGRKVVDHLLVGGARDVRALTAAPARAALPDGVEVVVGDLRKPGLPRATFEGVERMYLAPAPETAVDALALARAAGVAYVVDLSGEPESWWGGVTSAVEDSGLAWTHLWPADFMENSLTWAPEIRASDAVHEPFPEGRSAPTAMDDIARVAAAALLGDGWVGRSLDLTGPEVLTRVQAAATIGAARGRPVEFVTVTRDEVVATLAPMMGAEAEWYVDTVLAGMVDNPVEANTLVEEITGAPATTFAQWAATNAAAFS